MINCNPETVSTDYDTSDRLYFEPLTHEDVSDIIDAEDPIGVIVSLGGQTPLKLADRLPSELVLGTSPASIDLAEDREQWSAVCARLEIPQPAGGTATSTEHALEITARIGYPALVRPSYVLGGRAMEIVYDDEGLERAMAELAGFGSLGREGGLSAERPVLVDRFLEDATEVDVDAIRDATGDVVIGAVMEHVEEAGVHSGDSACSIPPHRLAADTVAVIEDYTRRIAEALDVRGLINVQYAVKGNQVFVIEANPRASRTVPFVAKATGVPLAKVASRVLVGATLDELRTEGLLRPRVVGDHVAVKEAVLPFNRFPQADAVLGPEMRSTGEVMGIDLTPGLAFVKAQLAAGTRLPQSGTVFMSLADRDKSLGIAAARGFRELGFRLAATAGTATTLREAGVDVDVDVAKLGEEGGVHAVDLIEAGEVQLVVNSPRGRGPRADGDHIRQAAGLAGVPLLTTGAAAVAAADGLRDWAEHPLAVRSLQGVPRRNLLMSRVDLTTRVGSVDLRAPVLTASGTAGHGPELVHYVRPGELGAVVVKSMKAGPWAGNPAPRVHPTAAGMLNSVGLQGEGVHHWLEHDLPPLLAAGATVVASIWGGTVDEYAEAADALAQAPAGVVAVEVNVSCPNLEDRRRMFAHSAAATAEVLAATEGCGRPRWAKLSPNAADLPEIAAAAVGAGAEALVLVNTLLGMAIDVERRRPVLGAGRGGLSGPAIHPVAVRAVFDVHEALPEVPIVGVGGTASGVDAVEFLLAGASAVEVGTATFADPRAPRRVLDEVEEWCAHRGVARIADLIGGAHG